MPHILTLSGLYPSPARPGHGLFVEERLRHLVASGEIRATVLAPVPWFPFTQRCFGTYGTLARTPPVAHREGLTVHYPRYLTVPKMGMSLAPLLLALALLPRVRQLQRQHPDLVLIDSHFLYPDGVAACLIGKWLRLPVLMTARGSDVNLFTQYRVPRRLIRWAMGQAARVITVSEALRHTLLTVGAEPAKVVTLPNGVDLERFQPGDRAGAKARLGLTGLTLLSVGNLLTLKGHHLVIEALTLLPEARALIAGAGPEERALKRLARDLGVLERVRFLGHLPRETLLTCYQGADALVLASSREGMPNVILESLACGLPVIATRVGGIPELLAGNPDCFLLPARSAAAIAEGVRVLQNRPGARARVAEQGARRGWQPTVEGLQRLIREVLAVGDPTRT